MSNSLLKCSMNSSSEGGEPQDEGEQVLLNGAGSNDVAGTATKGGDSRSNSRIIDDEIDDDDDDDDEQADVAADDGEESVENEEDDEDEDNADEADEDDEQDDEDENEDGVKDEE
ncbi:hypothetical protein OIO90_005655 [Microbotryomycetes sp. JL221]|nr:hypothetical protein OIO90_005655 [Microbotryomycetes sp. JL221]